MFAIPDLSDPQNRFRVKKTIPNSVDLIQHQRPSASSNLLDLTDLCRSLNGSPHKSASVNLFCHPNSHLSPRPTSRAQCDDTAGLDDGAGPFGTDDRNQRTSAGPTSGSTDEIHGGTHGPMGSGEDQRGGGTVKITLWAMRSSDHSGSWGLDKCPLRRTSPPCCSGTAALA